MRFALMVTNEESTLTVAYRLLEEFLVQETFASFRESFLGKKNSFRIVNPRCAEQHQKDSAHAGLLHLREFIFPALEETLLGMTTK